MKSTKDIAVLLDEPACEHNKKEKSGCAKPKPGASAGGCAFDGAQIALLPIADVAHIVHGPIACAGSSWDNRGTRSSGATLYRIGMTTDLTEQDIVMGRAEKRLFHFIPKGKGEHASKMLETVGTPFPVRMQNDLGIRMRSEFLLPQFIAKFPVIVDLAIVRDPIPGGIRHGLLTRIQVYNAQTPMGKSHMGVMMHPDPLPIWPAMLLKLVHHR